MSLSSPDDLAGPCAAVMGLLPQALLIVEGASAATATVHRANAAFVELTGTQPRPGMLLAELPCSFCDVESRIPLAPNAWPAGQAIERGEPVPPKTIRLHRADGSWRWVVVSAAPVRLRGQWWGAAVLFEEPSKPAFREGEDQALRGLLERLLAEVPAAVLLLEGPQHRCVLANPAAYSIARGGNDLRGRTMAEIWPEAAHLAIPILDHVYHAQEPHYATDEAIPIERGRGFETAFFSYACIPVDGALQGVPRTLVLALETTDQVLARQRLEQTTRELASEQARMQAVLSQMPAGVVIVEAPTGKVLLCNEEVLRAASIVLPRAPTEARDFVVLQGFRPDGRPYAFEEWPLFRSMTTGEVVRGEEMTFIHPDGQPRILSVNAAPIRDAEGRIVAAVLVFEDITVHKNAERALSESRRREQVRAAELQAVLDAVPAGVFITHDRAASVIEGNRAGYDIFGVPPGTNLSLSGPLPGPLATLRVVRGGRELSPAEMPIQVAAARGIDVRNYEFDFVFADGRVRHMLGNAAPFRDEQGAVRGAIGAFVDITKRKRAEERASGLQVLTASLAQALSVEDIGNVVLDQASDVLGAIGGGLALPTADGTELELRFDRKVSEEYAAAWRRVPLDAALPLAEVMRTGCELVLESDADWGARFPAMLAGPRVPGLGALVVFPLSVKGRVLGSAALGFVGARRFATEDLEFMRAFTGQVAQALERVQLYDAERKARALAQEANRAKDEFVALVSHELRNPLSAVQAGIFVLRQVISLEGRAGRALEIVERSVRLQARLVNDLLDLSRLSRGSLQLQRVPVELEHVVRAAVLAYEKEAEEAGLSLTSSAEHGLWVQGDFDRLQQVVMNLLSNAIKFTPRGGSVMVRAVRAPDRDGMGRVGVEDSGVGIEPGLIARLFDLFQQGEIGARRGRGLGIGLALVKGIVERHGGRVWAESAGAGKGSRFTVELPLVSQPRVPLAGERPPQELGSVRVLLVEDNADTRALLADGLVLAGYEVHAAASGEEALEVLQQLRPDIMLCDLGLPGIDGCEFLEQAHRRPGLERVPAFAVTAYGQEEAVRRGQRAGFLGHLTKPVDVQELDRLIQQWVHPARKHRS